MQRIREFARRLALLLRREQFDRDLQEEMRLHRELKEQQLVAAGIPAEQARYAAHRQLGNTLRLQEASRDAWGWSWLDNLAQDLRFAVRILCKTPVITTVALLSLALGIGANTAIFSLMDAVMLRMLPVRQPEELLQVVMRSPYSDRSDFSVTNPIWEQLRDHQDVFSGIFAWSLDDFDLAHGGESRYVNGLRVSGEFFPTLGVRPIVGRLFDAADDRRGCSAVAVLSYAFWQKHYGGAASAIGGSLALDGHEFQVVGVAPPGFFGMDVGRQFDVAVPVCTEALVRGTASALDARSAWWLRVVGRPRPGLNPQQAMVRLNILAPKIFAAAVPLNWKPEMQQRFRARTFVLRPDGTGLSELQRDYQRPLETLMAVVALVLLIACANIASLMLARAAARQKEIAVRLALGASRSRLIRQVLTESILLSAVGAALAVFFARWGCALLVRFISTSQHAVFLDLTMDRRILGFTAGLAILTALLFGTLPAFHATNVSLTSAIKGGSASAALGNSRFRGGRWIVVVQVGVSLILLVASGLLVRSFRNLLTLDAGFDRGNVLIAEVDTHNIHTPAGGHAAIFQQVLSRLRTLPGIVSVSQSVLTPLGNSTWNGDIHVDRGDVPSGDASLVYFNWIAPQYFGTLHSPLLAGRDFSDADRAESPRVAIVNEALAHIYFPHTNPVGRYFRTLDAPSPPIQIVALVKNAKYESLREEFLPTAYFPFSQIRDDREGAIFVLRTALDPASMVAPVRDIVGTVNKEISLEFRTLAGQVDDSLRQERLLAALSGFFGALGLLLATIGLYGVMAYMVSQRQKELGIRMALGAPSGSILRLVLREVVLVLAAGIAVGICGVLATTHLVQQLLFGLSPRDAATLAGAVLLLAAVAILAGYLPARRAARLDPMRVLREE